MTEPLFFRFAPDRLTHLRQLLRASRERSSAQAEQLVHVAIEVGAADAIELFRLRHRIGLHRCSCSACVNWQSEGSPMAHDLVRRQAATEATLGKYRQKPFSWQKGMTCVHLARFHLRQMGHTPPTLPRIRSAIRARKELQARGWQDVAQMLDSMLERISPARMMMGDLAAVASGDGLGAIFLCVGHKMLGWREDVDGIAVIQVELNELAGAWRV